MIGYRLPGPLEVSVNSRAIEIGGVKQRALLATLLRRANQPVSRDVLVHQLWGEYPPAGAQHSLEVYISRLRKTLEPAAGGRAVLTRPGACLLPVAAGTDRHQPVRASGRGRRARRALVEEPGIEPSPGLERVERAILEQDVALERPARAGGRRRLPRPETRRRPTTAVPGC